MDFLSFYNSLDPSALKIFNNKDQYFIFGNDTSSFSLPTFTLHSLPALKLSFNEYSLLIQQSIKSKSIIEFSLINNQYTIIKQGTPACWQDYYDLCLAQEMEPCIGALVQTKVTNIALLVNNNILYNQFLDDDICSLLFGIVVSYNVKELIVNCEKLKKNVEKLDLRVIKVNYKLEEEKEERIYGFTTTESELNAEHKAYNDNYAVNLLQSYLPSSYPIDILPIPSFLTDPQLISLVTFKFKCTTPQGKRLLDSFIRNPLTNEEEILKRQKCLIKDKISIKVSDMMKLIRKIEKGSLDGEGFLRLKNDLEGINEIIYQLSEIQKENLDSNIFDYSELIATISALLETTAPLKKQIIKLITPAGFLNPTSDSLIKLHNERNFLNSQLIDQHNSILKINSKIKLIDNNFRLSKVEFSMFEKQFKNISVLSYLKNCVIFTTKELCKLNEKWNLNLESIRNEEKRLLKEFNEEALNYKRELEGLCYCVGYVDVMSGMGSFINEGWCIPNTLSTNNSENSSFPEFMVKDAFHPSIKIGNVKNSIKITNNRFICITGPNMGGKSTFLKLIGLIALLHQIGGPVPALKANLPIFNSILIRIGANDCAYKHKSTFLLEMEDIAKIVRCTKNSLILIDELGRGTNDLDGLSLAMAVKDYLVDKQCISLFATHFTELCDGNTCNLQMEVGKYRLIEGIGRSYGKEVARMVGFPSVVLEEIERLIDEP